MGTQAVAPVCESLRVSNTRFLHPSSTRSLTFTHALTKMNNAGDVTGLSKIAFRGLNWG